MANTLKFGNGNWATKEGSTLAYNDENGNFKPLPFDFSRASKATVINKDGLIEEVGSGEPRVDYLNNTKGALKLEPSRSNLITYSEAISNTIVKSGNYADNFAISPDGTQNATKLTATNTDPYFYQDLSFSAASYTASIYVKGIGNSIGKNFQIRLANNIYTDAIPSEWTRFEYTVTTPSGTASVGLEIPNPAVIGDEVLVWGWQLEQGSYATSYIPTSGSAVTRLADSCNNGGNEQVINSTEGVLYAECSLLSPSTESIIISLSDGGSNRLYFDFFTSNRLYAIIENGSSTFSTVQTITQTNNNKLAFKYSASGCKLYINGTGYSFSGLNFSSGTLDTLNFASSNGTSAKFIGNVKDVRVYNTALSDSELAALTQV